MDSRKMFKKPQKYCKVSSHVLYNWRFICLIMCIHLIDRKNWKVNQVLDVVEVFLIGFRLDCQYFEDTIEKLRHRQCPITSKKIIKSEVIFILMIPKKSTFSYILHGQKAELLRYDLINLFAHKKIKYNILQSPMKL